MSHFQHLCGRQGQGDSFIAETFIPRGGGLEVFPACWKHPRGRNPNTQHRPGAQGCPQPPTLKGKGELMSLERKNLALCGRGDDSSTIFSCSASTGFTGIKVLPATPRCPAGIGEGAGDGCHIPNLSLSQRNHPAMEKNLHDMEQCWLLAGEIPGLCIPCPAGLGDSEDAETSEGMNPAPASCRLQIRWASRLWRHSLSENSSWECLVLKSGLDSVWRGKAEGL